MTIDIVAIGLFVLCLAGAIALCAAAYLLISVVKTMKKVEPLLDDAAELVEKAKPMVDDVAAITSDATVMVADIKPAMAKVDPMVDRVMLTIDAANLEIMRVDQIMEDVNVVTGNMAKASNSIETVSSAPLEVVGNVASKIKAAVKPVASNSASKAAPYAQAVETGLAGVEACVAEKQADLAEKKVVADEFAEARDKVQEEVNAGGAKLKNGVLGQIDADTDK